MALAQAVGQTLEVVQGLNQQVAKDYNFTQQEFLQVKNVIADEDEGLKQNEKYLLGYGTVTAEKLLGILGGSVKAMTVRAHDTDKQVAELKSRLATNEMQLDHLMGSEAMQQLLKIQASDDLAVKVLLEADEVAEWMKRYQNESTAFRARVDAALREADEEMWLHAQQVAEEDAEQKERDAKLAEGMKQGMSGMLNSINDAGTGTIAQDVEANLKAFKDAQAATDAADQVKFDSLSAQASRFPEQGAAAIAAGKDFLESARQQGRMDRSQYESMVSMLRSMVESQDGAISDERKRLQEQAQKLNEQLFFSLNSPSFAQSKSLSAPDQKHINALVEEAKGLAQEHQELEKKHEDTGKAISTLLHSVLRSAEQVRPS